MRKSQASSSKFANVPAMDAGVVNLRHRARQMSVTTRLDPRIYNEQTSVPRSQEDGSSP